MNAATLWVMDTNKEALDELRRKLKHSLKKRVAKAREDMQYSQPDVLEELERYGLGRTQGSISQIENGVRLPSAETLYVLAKYLNTSSDYFLGLTANALSVADIEEERDAASGQSPIDKILKKLTPEKRQQVLTFAEYLLFQEEGSGGQGAVPKISPIPLTEDQLLDAATQRVLDLVEENHGIPARRRIERQIREQLTGDNDAT